MLFKVKIDKGTPTTTITCWRNPTPGEIKFGEGAIHYRDFTTTEIGYNRAGKLKQWFKADDGLRYNRY